MRSAEAPLFFVLLARVLDGLPLHVAAMVAAAVAQWVNVVDDVARALAAALAGCWAWVLALEGELLRC